MSSSASGCTFWGKWEHSSPYHGTVPFYSGKPGESKGAFGLGLMYTQPQGRDCLGSDFGLDIDCKITGQNKEHLNNAVFRINRDFQCRGEGGFL